MHFLRSFVLCSLGITLLAHSSFAAYRTEVIQGKATLLLDGSETENDHSPPLTENEFRVFKSNIQSKRTRLYLKFYRSEALEELKRILASQTSCNEEELQRFLWNRIKTIPRVCATGIALAAGYVGNNYLIQKVNRDLPEMLQPSLPSLGMSMSMAFLTPYLTPFFAKLTQLTFNLRDSATKNPSSGAAEKLDRIWYRTSGKYSMNQEMARNTFILGLNSINLWLDGMSNDLRWVPAESAYPFLVERIAVLILRFENLFTEIQPWDLGLNEVVQERIQVYHSFIESHSFQEDILSALHEKDPQSDEKTNRDFVSAWIPKTQEATYIAPEMDSLLGDQEPNEPNE